MQRILKLVCLTLVFSMLLSLSAFAAEVTDLTVDRDIEKKTAVIEGKITDSEDDQQVVILVLANAELGDATIDDSNIAFIDQIAAEADDECGEGEKSFVFDFGISDKFKDVTNFNVYIGGTDVAKAEFKKLRFAEGGPGDCYSDDPNEITDGIVGYSDYIFVVTNYNQPAESDDPITQGRLDAADSDGSKVIDYPDYITVVTNYNNDYNN